MNEMVIVNKRLREIGEEIRPRLKSTWENVLFIGERTEEAKSLLVHGEYEQWVRDELGVSPSLIRGYRRSWRRFQDKSVNFAGLPLSSLVQLSSPSVSDGAVEDVIRRLQSGETLTVQAVDLIIEHYETLNAVYTGSGVILEQYGTENGVPASAVRSLQSVAGDALQQGTVTIDGVDHPATQPLPSAVVTAVDAETNRRRAGHIEDNSPAVKLLVDREKYAVAADVTNDCVVFRIPGIGQKLTKGEMLILTIKREVGDR